MKKMRNKKLDELISEIEDMQNDVDAISYEELWSYKSIAKDLEILDILRKNTRISKANSIRVYLSNSVYASEERARDYKIVKKWLENN